MTNRKAGWMIKIAASLLCLLLIATYSEAAEQQVIMEIEGMTCDL